VNTEVIGAMKKAKVIVRYGIGVDNVDLDAARARGIPVCNVPDYCIAEVADHTLAFILALTRQVLVHSNRVHAGTWGLGTPLASLRSLTDMTVGVVGFGRIGRAVVKRLTAFGGRVLVHDPVADPGEVEAAGGVPSDLGGLFALSDCVTLHCPSTARTRGMVNRQTLAAMKTGALLVNLARGDLVDSGALVEALDSGKLSGAALDVFSPEPIPPGHAILKRDNVILAPHIASASVPAVGRLRRAAAALAVAAIRGEPLGSVVNGVV
jgi:D-3-phosphoglycerate dehydrogenase